MYYFNFIRCVVLISFLSITGQLSAATMTGDEFEQLRQSIRSQYATNPVDAIKLTEVILNTEPLTLEQRIKVLNYKAWFLLETEQFEEATRTLVLFKSLTARSDDKSLMYGYYNISGGIYSKLELYDQALKLLLKALEQAYIRDEHLAYQTENNIGEVYLALERFDEAEEVFRHYYDYVLPLDMPLDTSIAMVNLAKAQVAMHHYDDAKILINKAMQLQNENNFTYHLSWSYQLLGQIARENNNFNKSINLLQKAIELRVISGTPVESVAAKLSLAKTYHEMGDDIAAVRLVKIVEQEALPLNNLTLNATIAKFSASLYESTGELKNALSAYKKYNQTKQALLQRQSNVNLAKALAESEMASKELKIYELTKEKQLKETQAKAFKELSTAIAIFLLIILFGSMYAIINIHRQKQRLADTLTELENTQAHLIEVEKMASLTSLVSGMAHQLNTPIGTVVTASSLIEDNLITVEQQFNDKTLNQSNFAHFVQDTKQAKDLVISNINRLAKMVDEFKALNVSIALDKPMVEVALLEFFKERVATLNTHLGKQVNYEICGENITITTYPVVLSDVLKTLIINSYEHGFKHQNCGHIKITVSKLNEQISVVFEDNGEGINEAILKEIFTPFYSTNPGGNHLGLGLNVVFNAIEHTLLGHICAEPSEHGARFIITLPMSGKRAANLDDEPLNDES